ncbi:MAG: YciI family protein [Alphaproteobacteria bacterium]|nr:YciI family protein [Alphaproteobacteria bacterium]
MLFSIKMSDKPGAGALRGNLRDGHLKYQAGAVDATLFGGPILAPDGVAEIGDHRLMAFDSDTDAQAHLADDPFIVGGLHESSEILPWSASVPFDWRDCPRTRRHIQFLIIAYDKPDSDQLRDRLRAEHEAFQSRVSDLYLTRGPLMNAANDRQIGSLMIVDVADAAAGHAFWAGEPFNYGGLFEHAEIYRWRFDDRLDRFASPD